MIDHSITTVRVLQSLTNETEDFVSGPQVNQDVVVDYEYCFGALARHDVNGNQRVDQQEYLNFVQDLGSNTECLGGLTELPIEIMACWNQLSCECRQRGGADDCCEGDLAHIPITGVTAQQPEEEDDATIGSVSTTNPISSSSSEPYIVEEQAFLRQTCLRTDQCVIAYCGVPPPPVIPPPPPAVPVTPIVASGMTSAQRTGIAFAILAGILILLCCLRRRWCFFAGAKKDDDDESSSESEMEEEMEGGGMRHLVTEEVGEEVGDIPPADVASPMEVEGDYNDPNANRIALRATAEDEDGEGGGVMYSRTVQEPEWEEDPVPTPPKAIEQFDPPPPPKEDFALNHVEKDPPPPPEEDPYALEHYVPDGGIVEYERTGEWSNEMDGGWTPEERATSEPMEWDHAGYDRQEVVVPIPIDNRKQRHIEAMGGGAIFDHLDEQEDNTDEGGGIGDMFSWVISSTLSTLDQKQDDLRSSGHSRGSDP